MSCIQKNGIFKQNLALEIKVLKDYLFHQLLIFDTEKTHTFAFSGFLF